MAGRDLRDLLPGPIVVGPMAGGPSRPELVLAATEGGALAFLAGGYRSADELTADLRAVRAATHAPYGVNIFVPGTPTTAAAEVRAYLASVEPEARALGAELGSPDWDDDGWEAKLAVLLADPPAVVSFTFGRPPRDVVAGLQAAGVAVVLTVTTAPEAAAGVELGVDGLCAQGWQAGGHRGGFDDGPAEQLDTTALVREIARLTDVPVIAAGGLMDAVAVSEALRAGAVAAQCGTAFLRCPESGAHPLHKAALVDPEYTGTAMTRAFSGRRARGLVNRFVRDHPDAPSAYPEINSATRPLRAAAAAAGDPGRMSLWAGTGHRDAVVRPAAEVVHLLTP